MANTISVKLTPEEINTLLMALECFYDNESQQDDFGYCEKIKLLQNKLK